MFTLCNQLTAVGQFRRIPFHSILIYRLLPYSRIIPLCCEYSSYCSKKLLPLIWPSSFWREDENFDEGNFLDAVWILPDPLLLEGFSDGLGLLVTSADNACWREDRRFGGDLGVVVVIVIVVAELWVVTCCVVDCCYGLRASNGDFVLSMNRNQSINHVDILLLIHSVALLCVLRSRMVTILNQYAVVPGSSASTIPGIIVISSCVMLVKLWCTAWLILRIFGVSIGWWRCTCKCRAASSKSWRICTVEYSSGREIPQVRPKTREQRRMNESINHRIEWINHEWIVDVWTSPHASCYLPVP